ncbi:MAG: right-handed parallel beta-helix repeat-containing protein [Chloroflexota bacterium]
MSVRVPRRLAAAAMASSLLAAAFVQPAAATVSTNAFVVSTLGDAIAADGKCSLREAMTDANNGSGNGSASAGECGIAGAGPYTVTFSVAGTITLTSALPTILSNSTIDGGDKITIDGAGLYRDLNVFAGEVTVQRITLDHGYVSGGTGAAVLNSSELTLSHVTIRNSHADGVGSGQGGAIFVANGQVALENSIVTGNQAYYGGAIMMAAGSMTVVNTSVTNNTGDWNGGAIYLGGAASVAVVHSTIANNSAGNYGAGIFAADTATVTINHSLIDGNTGGAMSSSGTASWTIVDTTVSNNATGASGGAFSGSAGTLTISTSTLSGNTSPSGGGAIEVFAGTVVVANSTIANNTAWTGAALAGDGTSVSLLVNDTITGNTSNPGAILNNGGGSITVKNSIIAGNTGAMTSGLVNTSLGNILAASAAGILDPGGLKDNGGPTKTVELLATAASAINAGDAATCAGSPVSGVDQRGVTRPAGACDIGAVERESTAPHASTPTTSFLVATKAGSSSVPVRVTAAWTDPGGSGVARFILQRRIGTGAWTTVTSSMPATGIAITQSVGVLIATASGLVDHDGNTARGLNSASATTTLVQQNSASVTYHGS